MMTMDRDAASSIKPGPSAAVLALGKEYAHLDGVNRLPENRRRPAGYYSANHVTGLHDLPADASEPIP
jgi:hypothetical protein